MKHLLYEHQENLTELKAEGTLSLKQAQKDHWAQEMELRKDMRSLKVELKEQELASEVVVKSMRLVRPSWVGAGQGASASEGGGGEPSWPLRSSFSPTEARGGDGPAAQRL